MFAPFLTTPLPIIYCKYKNANKVGHSNQPSATEAVFHSVMMKAKLTLIDFMSKLVV